MNLLKLMGAVKDLPKLKEEMATHADRLARETFSASDGQVTAVADGAQRLVSLEIAPEVLAAGAAEVGRRAMEQANAALLLAKQRVAEEMQRQMNDKFGGMPGLDGLFSGLIGK